MSEVTREFMCPGDPCDLVIVRADNASHVVEVRRDIAKLGDRVDFLLNKGLVCGFVEDILHVNCMDDTYCFIGTASPILKPSGVYSRVWTSEQLRESLLLQSIAGGLDAGLPLFRRRVGCVQLKGGSIPLSLLIK